jgi:hypothetical protein
VYRQFSLIAVILMGLTHIAVAKPRSSQADKVLENSKWAALVEVLSVKPSPGKGWRPTITVRVSDKSADLFRGAKAGAKLKVHPLPHSDDGTTSDLENLVGTGEALLMVVNKDNQIEFVGEPSQKKGQRKFHLRSWYDFNAWWIYSTDKTFGTRVELDGGPMQTLDLSHKEIVSRLK